jgi:hypothetical protein
MPLMKLSQRLQRMMMQSRLQAGTHDDLHDSDTAPS